MHSFWLLMHFLANVTMRFMPRRALVREHKWREGRGGRWELSYHTWEITRLGRFLNTPERRLMSRWTFTAEYKALEAISA